MKPVKVGSFAGILSGQPPDAYCVQEAQPNE